MRHGARPVPDNLHFYVPRARHELLDVHVAVAERGVRLGLAARVGIGERIFVLDDAHTAAPAAGHRLDDGGATRQRRQEGARLLQTDRVGRARQHRHVSAQRGVTSRDLVAEQAQQPDRRPDEHDAGLVAARRKSSVFTEKTVAGMDRLTVRGKRHCHNLFDVQIRGGTRARQRDRFISHLHVQRLRVVGRVHRDANAAEITRGAGDADRDFAAIGDEEPVERRRRA